MWLWTCSVDPVVRKCTLFAGDGLNKEKTIPLCQPGTHLTNNISLIVVEGKKDMGVGMINEIGCICIRWDTFICYFS